ncbi:MAG: tripartite tricarboxylate transporter substrate binding protein [Pigmentiphaga sp.]|nr:tripartite tricarboxylate transporter substrate binding protein [Pigmentiphaga sp.]
MQKIVRHARKERCAAKPASRIAAWPWQAMRQAAAVSITCLALGAPAVAAAQAAAYPAKPVSILIGAAAGGGLDYIARSFTDALSKELGQPVIVDYRPGAAGLLAADAAAKAAPDGYTLWVADVGPLAVHPSLYSSINYNAEKDFSYLGMLAQIPLVLVTHPSVGANDLDEFTALAAKQPGMSYGSVGVGNGTHLTMELYKQRTGTDLRHVPYRGVAPAITDVLGGHIETMFVDIKTAAPHIREGRLKALALAAAERNPALPEVPTFGEAGIEGFDVSPWVGLAAPAGLPEPVATRLREALAKVTQMPETRQRLADGGFIPLVGSAQRMEELAVADRELWGNLIRERGIRVE